MVKSLKRYLLTGLLVLLPLFATAYVCWYSFALMDGWIGYFGIRAPGVGIAVLILLLLLTGVVTKNYLGYRLHKLVEWLMVKIPVVSSIYSTIKEVTKTLLDRDKHAFQYVVAFKSDDHWKLGFVTGDAPQPIGNAIDGVREYKLVYVMNAFSPASGIVFVVAEENLRKIDMPIETALKLVLTGGMVIGDKQNDRSAVEAL